MQGIKAGKPVVMTVLTHSLYEREHKNAKETMNLICISENDTDTGIHIEDVKVLLLHVVSFTVELVLKPDKNV